MTKLVKCISTPKLNISNMFFYLKSKQKAKLHNLVITMFLGFVFKCHKKIFDKKKPSASSQQFSYKP